MSVVRFSTFNASLYRLGEGDLVRNLSTPDNTQAKYVAEIIQRARPDVLLVNEFDYDDQEYGKSLAARYFQENYLSRGQNNIEGTEPAEPLEYSYRYTAPSNTGIDSGFDLDKDGDLGGPGDAYGFGSFPGQYGMTVYSMYPIDFKGIRTFQLFLWKDMPGALLPFDPDTGKDLYSEEELEVVRLSSKSHWDIPIVVAGRTVHFLTSHPTPPVFDGPEDRNGKRNHDEIRFWADYIIPSRSGYVYDDQGRWGGLAPGALFVIAGDQNADPYDGDSIRGVAQQLLEHSLVNSKVTPSSPGGIEQSELQGGINERHLGDPAYDTADFSELELSTAGNLRVDYVLPSKQLFIEDAGVFWPLESDPLFGLVGTYPFPGSDHRLVWIDVRLPVN